MDFFAPQRVDHAFACIWGWKDVAVNAVMMAAAMAVGFLARGVMR